VTDDEHNGPWKGYIRILPTWAAAAKYGTTKEDQQFGKAGRECGAPLIVLR
jgi:hypothetical protein